LGILSSSILCTCPIQRDLCSVIVSVMVGRFINYIHFFISLTLSLPMSYIYGAACKATNVDVVYIWTYVWQR
jgi:hypothetical protein